ncbi:uncharacterized protein (TIGR00369 family) [Bacillus ectoiniformans]|uniref:PaaI family thioesterase n=1 Tax=Bacillus ectoiniformans TaxID=1494429 RepID=UPI0019570E00|nr:PaaI family thioesterase [Bacillus ectoiniformans]MBM7649052.1 uncharacterized protein (TIGR00369 family) [Bacillus ectoiniformans]
MLLTVEEIKQELDECPYLHHLGIEIMTFEEGNVTFRLPVSPHLLNTNGTLHGGVYASLIDFVQSMYLRSVTKTRCVTTSLTVHFTKPIKTGYVYAEAEIISKGYKIAFVDGVLKDEEGNVICKGTGTFKLIHA